MRAGVGREPEEEPICCRLRKRGNDAGRLRREIGVGGFGESAGCAAPGLVAEGEGMSVSARSAAAEERSVNSSTMGESQLWAAATRVGGSRRGGLCGHRTGLGERPEARWGRPLKEVGWGRRRARGAAAAGPGGGEAAAVTV